MTIKEQARLDRIQRNIVELEELTDMLKSMESQIRAVRGKRNRVVVKLKDAGVSERAIGRHAGMAGPSVNEIYHRAKTLKAVA